MKSPANVDERQRGDDQAPKCSRESITASSKPAVGCQDGAPASCNLTQDEHSVNSAYIHERTSIRALKILQNYVLTSTLVSRFLIPVLIIFGMWRLDAHSKNLDSHILVCMININISGFDYLFAQTPGMFVSLQHKPEQFLNQREMRPLWLIAGLAL